MKAADYYKHDDDDDRKEIARLRQQREANERALAAQAADRAWLRDYQQRLARTMQQWRCTEDEARRHLLQDEELDRVVQLANERNAARQAAELEEECASIGASPWLATERKETKASPLALSQLPAPAPPMPTGRFTGLAAAFGNTDSYNDEIERGAFAKTIAAAKARGKPFLWPLLYQHDPNRVIGGVASATERPDGLYVECQLDLSTRDGAEAYSLVRGGFLDGLSVGYVTKRSTDRGGVRHLLEMNLLEVSIVTFAANSAATVTRTGY